MGILGVVEKSGDGGSGDSCAVEVGIIMWKRFIKLKNEISLTSGL